MIPLRSPRFARAGVPPMADSMPPAAMSLLPPTQHLAPQMQRPPQSEDINRLFERCATLCKEFKVQKGVLDPQFIRLMLLLRHIRHIHVRHLDFALCAQGVRRISGDRSTQALFHRWILGCRDTAFRCRFVHGSVSGCRL